MFPLYLVAALSSSWPTEALMLSLITRPLLARHLGNKMLRRIEDHTGRDFLPVAYIAAVLWLASGLTLMEGRPLEAARKGVMLSAMAHGTYERTPTSMIKGWA